MLLTPDNDPYGERDFGAFERNGERIFRLKFQIGSDSILLIYREIVQKFSCQLLATD